MPSINLSLTDQYIEALSKIYEKAQVLMLPDSDGKGADLSLDFAQAISVYKQIMGDKTNSKKLAAMIGGQGVNNQTLEKVM